MSVLYRLGKELLLLPLHVSIAVLALVVLPTLLLICLAESLDDILFNE